jgi:hypothetical protein
MWANLLLSGIFLLLAYGVYRLSLCAHAQYGEFFKALFDQHRSLLQHRDVLEYLVQATGNRSLSTADFKEANMAIWRYLRWHKVRLTGQEENSNFESIRAAARGMATPIAAHVPPTVTDAVAPARSDYSAANRRAVIRPSCE